MIVTCSRIKDCHIVARVTIRFMYQLTYSLLYFLELIDKRLKNSIQGKITGEQTVICGTFTVGKVK